MSRLCFDRAIRFRVYIFMGSDVKEYAGGNIVAEQDGFHVVNERPHDQTGHSLLRMRYEGIKNQELRTCLGEAPNAFGAQTD